MLLCGAHDQRPNVLCRRDRPRGQLGPVALGCCHDLGRIGTPRKGIRLGRRSAGGCREPQLLSDPDARTGIQAVGLPESLDAHGIALRQGAHRVTGSDRVRGSTCRSRRGGWRGHVRSAGGARDRDNEDLSCLDHVAGSDVVRCAQRVDGHAISAADDREVLTGCDRVVDVLRDRDRGWDRRRWHGQGGPGTNQITPAGQVVGLDEHGDGGAVAGGQALQGLARCDGVGSPPRGGGGHDGSQRQRDHDGDGSPGGGTKIVSRATGVARSRACGQAAWRT